MRADTSQELQMVRALKFYSHSNFQVYNAVLTIVTMLYIVIIIICLISESLYHLTIISPISLNPLAPENHHSTVSISLMFLDSPYKQDHKIFVFLSLSYST